MNLYPKLALVGRPNVGKSTLFNRLTGTRHALVHDKPGMTRDRREGEATLFDFDCIVEDTPGITEMEDLQFYHGMHAQTLASIESADGVLFIVDGVTGCTPAEKAFANDLRRIDKPVWVIVNKSEGDRGLLGLSDAALLPFKNEPIALSALHNEGLYDLYYVLKKTWPKACSPERIEGDRPLKITVLGRPNVGKSTLVNTLIQEERLLVADYSGVTRDAISLKWHYQGRDIMLTDTAGIRRSSKVDNTMEQLAVMDAKRALQYSDVALAVLDATQALDKQDLTLLRMISDEGRGLIILVNKWDLAQGKGELRKKIQNHLEKWIPHVKGAPVLFISAHDKALNIQEIFKTILTVHENWNRRIPTARLNQWLEHILDHNPPPMTRGRRIRIKYITQIKSRPPTFSLHCTKGDEMDDSYKRYLMNQLRECFSFEGTPLRLVIKTNKNPYAQK